MFQFKGRLYVLRHSLTQENIEGVCVGSSEANILMNDLERVRTMAREILLEVQITYLLSSSLLRAKQTALQLQKDLGIHKCYVDRRFDDLDFGVFTGQDPRKICELQPEIYDERGFFLYDVPLLNGESLQMLEHRVTSGLKDVYYKNNDGNTLIVTHGSVIVMIHKVLSGMDYYQFYPAVDKISHNMIFHF